MNMFRHKDKCVQFIAAFATIPIYRLQEEASVRLDNKQSPALPGRERHKVSSRRGDESSRLQGKPQRLEAAVSLRLNRHEWNSCPSR